MKQLAYLLVLFFIIYSCANQKLIMGIYSTNWYDTSHSLELNPDSTFNFIFKEGLLFDSINGKWGIKKNKLILNSYISLQDTKSFLDEKLCDACQEGINIKVIDFESKHGMQYASISAFNHGNIVSELATNKNGNAIIKNQELDSIKVDYIGYNSFTFTPNNDFNKLSVINMKLEELNRYVITNEIWKIKKNRIVSPEGLILKKVMTH